MRLFRAAKKHMNFLSDQRGSAVVIWALVLPMVIGGVGLGLDVGSWQLRAHDVQSAVDAAVISTGYTVTGTGTQTTLTSTATSELARNISLYTGKTITVHNPPTSGSYTSNNWAVELIVTEPQPRSFSSLFTRSDPVVTRRSVALRQAGGNVCVLALDGTVGSALELTGSSNINLDCIAASNSTSSSSIDISGSASLDASNIYTAGGYTLSGSADLTTDSTPITSATPITDPYSSLSPPSFSGCGGGNNKKVSGTTTISPGVYCNGLTINAGAVVTFSAGTYIIDRGTFKINGGATVTGSNVTIILTSSTGSNYAIISINGGATVTLTPPSTGTYAGVTFFQDRRASVGNVNRFNGGSTMNISGVLYVPNGEIDFTGGNSTTGSCMQIIGRTVTFSGNSKATASCTVSGMSNITTPGSVTLVE